MSRKSLVPIVLPADPTAALEAATKQYVDGKSKQPGWLRANRGATTTLTLNTLIQIVFDSRTDPAAGQGVTFGAGAYTTAGFVVPVAGLYMLSLQGAFTAGGRIQQIITSDTGGGPGGITGGQFLSVFTSGNTNVLSNSLIYPLPVGAVIGAQLAAYGTAGTASSVALSVAGPLAGL